MSDVERAIVGMMLASSDMVPDIIAGIKSDDFTDWQARAVYEAVEGLWVADQPTDILSVNQALDDDGQLSRVGGPVAVFEMSEQAPPPSSASHHIAHIRDESMRRRLVEAGQRIEAMGRQLEPSEALGAAQKALDGVLRTDAGTVSTVGDSLDETLEDIRTVASGERTRGLPTGFYRLDEMLHGLSGGQMIIVAARPGVGKSTIAVDFMRENSIKHDTPTLMFSLEMSKTEVNQRILSAQSEVPLTKIINGDLSDDDWGRISDADGRIREAPLFVDDSADLTITDIIAKTKMMVKRHNIGMIVVDYLQLLRSGQREESRQQEVSGFSRQLKLLAKSCDIPVIAICQLNRGPESRGEGAKPMASDLRESGSLEQDADVILLLNRPELRDPDSPRMGEADVIVAKNRRGKTGEIAVVSQLKYSRFSNLLMEGVY